MEVGTRDSAQPVSTAEEEFLKRNTDCVYFLASPLTCKKGSECEYRHSEAARINPRDCWFWMNGNCLNPKCAFRHPPLDGLIGTPGTPSVGLSVPPSQSVASPKMPPGQTPAYSSGKPAVPCYYFQKGLCLKGDRCAFVHGSQPLSNPLPQHQEIKAATTVSEPLNPKKTYGGLERCNQQQTTQENIRKSIEVRPPPKPAMKPETSPPKNSIVKRNILPPTILDDERPKYMSTNAPPNASGNSVPRPQLSRQAQAFDDRFFQDGKEADEFLRESSPGFDVLVDDELRDSDYYHAEDEFRRTASHEGRRLNSVNDFDYDRSVDYAPVTKYDQEPYDDPRGYDSYGQVQDQYAWEQRRASSEWTERPTMPEKRGFSRVENLDQIDESDLRQRLSKQRRVNGLRSAVSPDRHGDVHRRDDRDRHSRDQRNRGRSSRDSRHIPHESSRSNRLHGRLTLPGRSSPDRNQNDSRLEREIDRGMNRSRLSPGRPPISSHQGRQEGRIKRPGQDDFREARNIRGGPNRRDEVDSNTSYFAGPKSLAELKSSKVSESTEARHAKVRQGSQLKEQKNLKLGQLMGHQDSDGSLPFEGPKPLSEILKRKREAETSYSGNSTGSQNGQLDSPKESGEIITGSSRMSAERETVQTSEPEKETNHQTHSRKEDADPDIAAEDNEEGQITTEGDDVVHEVESSDAQKGTELETEDGMMVDDAMEDQEDQELENFDHKDGEYDYEQADGGDDDNVDPEEYLDDEDGDDFAKKIGVMFS
ncbi:zinc finger CCCH domain-containing protein 19-like [Telopea speciosissima]|uniref:zinc finger CCCH domain-containing protein 19-like n=1 Tax=Telopea speciosissima TaxID=54955 RepID=UPI001CC7FE52|nr:zinc finger CCCH domain-containing protein 19-like [Telopea speciosissima]